MNRMEGNRKLWFVLYLSWRRAGADDGRRPIR